MKIGYVQFAPSLGDVHATMRQLDYLVGSEFEVDLLVLPELCNSGYHFVSREQAWGTAETVPDGVFVRYLEGLCRRQGCHIVSGLNERDGEQLYNSAVLVGPGGYVGKYRKLHLFLNELDYFAPGDLGLPVFDLGPARIGLLICFDWIFTEVWRILALKGADIICHPANLVLPYAQKAVPIHALTNRVYIVTANRTGTEWALSFTGLSTIANTHGEIIRQASSDGSEVGIVEIDPALARDKAITPRNDVLGDRRPEVYGELLRK
ncbi:MAG: carbon-nitrogen hydrolase [Chloroflexia bacterium]|nr:carbon-nitrogen hydrolase [Chloroflexia bacterium]